MPNFDGLIYLFTVPVGVVVGLAVDLGIALAVGPTWWLIAPPAIGFWCGVKIGGMMSR